MLFDTTFMIAVRFFSITKLKYKVVSALTLYYTDVLIKTLNGYRRVINGWMFKAESYKEFVTRLN